MIHNVWSLIFKTFRARRFRQFVTTLRHDRFTRMLDVGGYPATWEGKPIELSEIRLINVHEINLPTAPQHHYVCEVVDGCALPYADVEFDIGYSNSVIEHVGGWERQQQFAAEIRRTSKQLWVQTPAYECFMEPHFLTPFIHWLPVEWRVRLTRNFTVWGWLTRPNAKQVRDFVNDIHLLTYAQMKQLFPDCIILREKMLGVFIKSYIAVRKEAST
jgi:hypothetical protein